MIENEKSLKHPTISIHFTRDKRGTALKLCERYQFVGAKVSLIQIDNDPKISYQSRFYFYEKKSPELIKAAIFLAKLSSDSVTLTPEFCSVSEAKSTIFAVWIYGSAILQKEKNVTLKTNHTTKRLQTKNKTPPFKFKPIRRKAKKGKVSSISPQPNSQKANKKPNKVQKSNKQKIDFVSTTRKYKTLDPSTTKSYADLVYPKIRGFTKGDGNQGAKTNRCKVCGKGAMPSEGVCYSCIK